MSVIRDRILRGERAVGTISDISEWFCESISEWTPIQKAKARAELDCKLGLEPRYSDLALN